MTSPLHFNLAMLLTCVVLFYLSFMSIIDLFCILSIQSLLSMITKWDINSVNVKDEVTI